MSVKTHPETGHFQHIGSVHEGGARPATMREIVDLFSGPDGERLRSDITQDCLRRGQRVPLPFKLLSEMKDRETYEQTIALNNVEQLRRKRLWREKATGVITEAEYQKKLKEGLVV